MSKPKPDQQAIASEDRLAKILSESHRDGQFPVDKTNADFQKLHSHEQEKLTELGQFLQLLEQVEIGDPAHPSNSKLQHAPDEWDLESREVSLQSTNRFYGSKPLPAQIGPYRIHEQIGKGGYGVVYLATDPTLDRNVALKVIQPAGQDEQELKARFEREARAVALLSHPGIIPIFDFGSDGPKLFIAFELCEGRSLDDCLAENEPLPHPEVAAKIIKRLAESIQHAHSRGIIHRDLKPNNILLQQSKTPSSPRATQNEIDARSLRIGDFGLAKILDENDTKVTGAGFCVGTPNYMAPEQATGEYETTPKSDIYSLGAIFYRLLTGTPPHHRATRVATLQALIHEDCESPRRKNRNVSRDLAAICLKCLERNPEHRYESSQALADDLDRLLEGRRVEARDATAWESFLKWRRRHSMLANAVLISSIAILIGIFLTTWQWRRAESNLRLSEQQAQRAEENLTKAEEAIDRMLNDVAQVLEFQPGMTEFRQKLLADALELQETILESERSSRTTLRTIQAYRRVARINRLLGNRSQAIASCQTAIQLATETQQPNQELQNELILCEQDLAALLLLDEQFEQARQVIQQAFRRIKLLPPTTDNKIQQAKMLAENYSLSARIHDAQGNQSEGANDLTAAIELLTPLRQTSPAVISDLASYFNSLAIIQKKLGEEEQALENLFLSVSSIESIEGEHHGHREVQVKIATTGINLGNHFSSRRDYQRAKDAYAKSLETLSELTTTFPSIVSYQFLKMTAETGLGVVEHRLGNSSVAERLFRTCIANGGKLDSDNALNPATRGTLLRAYGGLATLYQSEGRFVESDQQFAEAIEMVAKLVSNHPENLDHRHTEQLLIGNRGLGMMKQGNYQDSAEQFKLSLRIASETLQQNPNNGRFEQAVIWNQRMCAHALAYAGETEECIKSLQELILSSEDQKVGRSQTALGVIASIVGGPLPGSTKRYPISEIEKTKFATAAIEIITSVCETNQEAWDLLPLKKLESAFAEIPEWKHFIESRSNKSTN